MVKSFLGRVLLGEIGEFGHYLTHIQPQIQTDRDGQKFNPTSVFVCTSPVAPADGPVVRPPAHEMSLSSLFHWDGSTVLAAFSINA